MVETSSEYKLFLKRRRMTLALGKELACQLLVERIELDLVDSGKRRAAHGAGA